MQKTLIAIILLIIFNGIIFIFIIQPAIVDIKTFNDQIQMERVALENKYTSRRNIKNIIADLKYVTDGIAPLEEKIIVKKDGQVAFISGLEKIANENNVAQKIGITASTANEAEIKNSVAKKNISITISGDYINVLKYISDLEKYGTYIMIDAANIGSGGAETGANIISSGNVKAYLEGYVYFSI